MAFVLRAPVLISYFSFHSKASRGHTETDANAYYALLVASFSLSSFRSFYDCLKRIPGITSRLVSSRLLYQQVFFSFLLFAYFRWWLTYLLCVRLLMARKENIMYDTSYRQYTPHSQIWWWRRRFSQRQCCATSRTKFNIKLMFCKGIHHFYECL